MTSNDPLELRDLRYFVAAAEELHFTRAAQRLHITQQVLSAAIRQLELRLGAPLFERTTRRVRLTPAGEAMLPFARRALAAAAEAGAAARDVGQGIVGHLRVAVSHSATGLGTPILRAMRERAPWIEIEVRMDFVSPLVDALVSQDLDAAILYCPERSPDLDFQRLSDEPTIVVTRPNHRLARRRRLRLSDLSGEIVLLAPSAMSRGYNEAVLALLHREGVTLRTAESAPPYMEAIGLAPGEAFGILTETALASIPTEGKIIRIPLEGCTLPFDLVWHPALLTPSLEALRSIAAECACEAGWPRVTD